MSTQGDRHEALFKHTGETNSRLEQINVAVQQTGSQYGVNLAELQTRLGKIDEAMSTLATSKMLQDTFDDSDLTRKDDLVQLETVRKLRDHKFNH